MKAKLFPCAALALLLAAGAHAGNFNVIRSFGILTNVTGIHPYAPLIQGPDDTLYGITLGGEGNIRSVVFRINPDGSGFQGLAYLTNGILPYGGLVLAGNMLYGTTASGGTNGAGNIFGVSTNGAGFKEIYDLGAGTNDGIEPYGRLVFTNGFLYGTTEIGGDFGYGAVFAINTNGTGYSNLVSFNLTNGAEPQTGLLLSGNALYGTSYSGGTNNDGTIFKVNPDGSSFTNLHYFKGNPDGANPHGDLMLAGGTLFGNVRDGGTTGSEGAIFAINTNGSGYTNFYNFSPLVLDTGTGGYTNYAGAQPEGCLLLAGNTLYGTTEYGGANDVGTIYQVNTNGGSFSVIHTFQSPSDVQSGLVLSGTNFYGVNFYSGAYGFGALFSLTTNGANFSNFLSFSNSDAASPQGPLLFSNGTLFGPAEGGAYGIGAIFRINTDGSGYTNLASFSGIADQPAGNLVLLGNALYGTTATGVNTNYGVVFRINTDGSGYTNLVYSPAGFGLPAGGLIYYNGLLYGQSPDGGDIFTATTNGGDNPDFFSFHGTGYGYPAPPLLPSGSVFYGVVESGGGGDSGAVFSLSTNGSAYNTLYSFSALNYNSNSVFDTNTDGSQPSAPLIQSGNTLFGTTQYGGFHGFGTVYRVDINGTNFMNLHDFTGGSDGAEPTSALALTNGTLYGAAAYGGNVSAPGGGGTVFSLATNGAGFTVLHTFTGPDGANPIQGIILSSNTLYGDTTGGGNLGEGVIFSVVPGPVLSARLASGKLILSWSDPAYSLQATPTVNGIFTNLNSATSPYTNTLSAAQEYFRLLSN